MMYAKSARGACSPHIVAHVIRGIFCGVINIAMQSGACTWGAESRDANGVALANVIELRARAHGLRLDILICSNSGPSEPSSTAHEQAPPTTPLLQHNLCERVRQYRRQSLTPPLRTNRAHSTASHGHGLELKNANHLDDTHLVSPPTCQTTWQLDRRTAKHVGNVAAARSLRRKACSSHPKSPP